MKMPVVSLVVRLGAELKVPFVSLVVDAVQNFTYRICVSFQNVKTVSQREKSFISMLASPPIFPLGRQVL